ncbi:glycosyltransferase [Vibrio cyclitrophicus]
MEDVMVSVICLAYNHEKYISETLDGFINQNVNFTFEVLVGEDCSDDATRAIILNYQEKYPSIIKLLTDEHNVGMNRNFKRLLEKSKGKYIAMCEGDDYWIDSSKLQTQYDLLESNADTVGCFHDFTLKEGDIFRSSGKEYCEKINIKEMSKSVTPIQTLTVMFRNVKEDIFPDKYIDEVTGTYFIFMSLSRFGDWEYIDKVMAVYRIHPGGIWSGKNNFRKAEMSIVNISAMCDFFAQDDDIIQNMKEQHRLRTAYFLMFFIFRLKFREFFFFLEQYRRYRRETPAFIGLGKYPKELLNSVLKRFFS